MRHFSVSPDCYRKTKQTHTHSYGRRDYIWLLLDSNDRIIMSLVVISNALHDDKDIKKWSRSSIYIYNYNDTIEYTYLIMRIPSIIVFESKYLPWRESKENLTLMLGRCGKLTIIFDVTLHRLDRVWLSSWIYSTFRADKWCRLNDNLCVSAVTAKIHVFMLKHFAWCISWHSLLSCIKHSCM